MSSEVETSFQTHTNSQQGKWGKNSYLIYFIK